MRSFLQGPTAPTNLHGLSIKGVKKARGMPTLSGMPLLGGSKVQHPTTGSCRQVVSLENEGPRYLGEQTRVPAQKSLLARALGRHNLTRKYGSGGPSFQKYTKY